MFVLLVLMIVCVDSVYSALNYRVHMLTLLPFTHDYIKQHRGRDQSIKPIDFP